MEKLKEYTKEDLKGLMHYLTVGELKRFLAENDLPDEAPVVIQRVHDVYFNKHGWGVYLKEGEHAYQARKFNKDIEEGKYLDKAKYPNAKEATLSPFPEAFIKESMEQYHPAWSCCTYKGDEDILFIDLHY